MDVARDFGECEDTLATADGVEDHTVSLSDASHSPPRLGVWFGVGLRAGPLGGADQLQPIPTHTRLLLSHFCRITADSGYGGRCRQVKRLLLPIQQHQGKTRFTSAIRIGRTDCG